MTDPHSDIPATTGRTGKENLLGAKIDDSAKSLGGPIPGVRVCVIGGGYVGLVTAAGLAEFGHNVVCVEKDEQKLRTLVKGKVPFYEPELERLLKENIANKRLSFSPDLSESAEKRQAVFIAVGTPQSLTGRTDMGALELVADQLSVALEPEQVVVIKSTAPVGTAAWLRNRLQESFAKRNGSKAPSVISNPEFLREGSAVYDFFNPQRIVIGGDNSAAIELISHIHRLGMKKQAPIVTTNNETAEMIKYASNVFLATKIGFINELSGLCDHLSVNVMEVARAMGMDTRIGGEFLQPGPGWGGSCLPKDISEYAGLAQEHGLTMHIAQAVQDANRAHIAWVANKTLALVEGANKPIIGALGLAFKAGTNDTRHSPAAEVIRRLRAADVTVRVYDPQASDPVLQQQLGYEVCESIDELTEQADCLIVLTEWSEFQFIDWERVGQAMRSRNLVDARNLFPPEALKRHGFTYEGVGQF